MPVDLSTKNLINIGVFTAIYFVISFASGMLGIIGPQFILVGMVIGGLINAVVMMLYLVRTPTIGALTITGFVIGVLFFFTGHTWISIIVNTIFGFLGDLICASGQFKSRWKNILGYAVFTLSGISPLIPIFINSDEYFALVAEQMNNQAYADQMRAIFQPTSMVLMLVAVFCISVVGGYIGTKVLDKHFVRAGIV
ncbi:MptD family putative ECF transporter S component [Stomatohabitans albus]|uniref:MptD family putative ECF transporter S component n=1 Tax=Stomatohabitans albus TaxID=3110766 RepID=UPI00300CCD70